MRLPLALNNESIQLPKNSKKISHALSMICHSIRPTTIHRMEPERYKVVREIQGSQAKPFPFWMEPPIDNIQGLVGRGSFHSKQNGCPGNSHLEPMFLKFHLRPEANVCYQGMVKLIGWAPNCQLMVLFLIGCLVFAVQFLFGELSFPQTTLTDDAWIFIVSYTTNSSHRYLQKRKP